MICDGSGAEPFPGDLRFEQGIITEIGSCRSGDLPETDLEGNLLTPGFIDIHAHSDLSLLAAPAAFGKISQGVTTEISGNCGLSPFPVTTPEVKEHLDQIYRKYGVPITWKDYLGYCSAVEQEAPSVNFGSFCGYNTLRANFTGYEDSPFPPEKILEMRSLLSETLSQGALGLSMGLLYVPGKFASEEELNVAASALKGSGKLITAHLRSEGDSLLESVKEMIRIAKNGDSRLQISHLKTALPRNWNKISPLLELIHDEQNNGSILSADRYPYTFAQTSLSVILPPPWDVMSDAAILEDLNLHPEKLPVLTERLRKSPPDWDRIILCSTAYAAAKPFAGKPYLDVCRSLGTEPETLCAELMRSDAPGTMAAFGGLSEENLLRILQEPYVCCGSDETARPEDFSLGQSHPRGFGSFPKFYRLLSPHLGIGETIRKMTSLPAELCGLHRRGLLKKGFAADFAVLDPLRFTDRADFEMPHAPADGVAMVFVNGVLSYTEGRVTGRAGRAVRFSRDQELFS